MGGNNAHSKRAAMGMYGPIMASDVAPTDNLATNNGHEAWIASCDSVHHESSGLIQRRRLEKGQVLSLTRNDIERVMKAFDMLRRYRHDRDRFNIAAAINHWLDRRHPSEMDPVAQAGPRLPVEPVALDRHLAGDDRVQHALSGILEAALVDHAARGRIDDPRRGMQHLDRRLLEGEVDQRVGGFGRIAALPVGFADPVAELQPAIGGVEPGAADESVGARPASRHRRCRSGATCVMARKARASASP